MCTNSEDRLSIFGSLLITAILFISLAVVPVSATMHPEMYTRLAGISDDVLEQISPESLLIITNSCDQEFLVDFSHVFKNIQCSWLATDDVITDPLKENDIMLIGCPDSAAIWGSIVSVLSDTEIDPIISGKDSSPIVRTNPWNNAYAMIICAGADIASAKACGERVIYLLMEGKDSGSWINPPFISKNSDDIRTYLSTIMYIPGADELSKAEMISDIYVKERSSVSKNDAIEDVQYLFDILEHGYCGYGYFGKGETFDTAEAEIIEIIATNDSWPTGELESIIHDRLYFVNDCHLRIGDQGYCRSSRFYYDTTLEFTKGENGYQTRYMEKTWLVDSVDGHDVKTCFFPSLNELGMPIYRAGLMSAATVENIHMHLSGKGESLEITLPLTKSPSYPNDVYEQDEVGEIPVIRIGSFSDTYSDTLKTFVESAKTYSGEPYIIVDVRGNGGGNSTWGKKWVRGFSGQEPSGSMTFAELITKTTMVGRYNYLFEIFEKYSGIDKTYYASTMNSCLSNADLFESGAASPYWGSYYIPYVMPIENETTVIVITTATSPRQAKDL